jgi:RNA polymerase II subunit A small phosphatase-like protein
MAAAEVYTPAAPLQHRGQAAWRAVVGWLGFLLQVLLRVIRGAPSSCAKLLKFLGLRHPLLSAAPAVAFARLPTEAPADELRPLPPLSPSPGRLTVRPMLALGRIVPFGSGITCVIGVHGVSG